MGEILNGVQFASSFIVKSETVFITVAEFAALAFLGNFVSDAFIRKFCNYFVSGIGKWIFD